MLISWIVSNKNLLDHHFVDLPNHISQINGWFVNEDSTKASIIINSGDKKSVQFRTSRYKSLMEIEEQKIIKLSKLLGCKDTSSPDIEPESVPEPHIDLFACELQEEVKSLCKKQNLPFISKLPWPNGAVRACCITHDVDLVRKYGPKQIMQSLVDRDFKNAGIVFQKLYQRENPYWNFSRLLELYQEKNWRATFFFLAKTWEKSGLRYNIKTPRFRELFKAILAGGHEIGLHSSRFIFDRPEDYFREKNKLETIIDREIKGVRQHYLRILFPDGWRYLNAAGFQYDSSCGYNNGIGFRAGTSFPFNIRFPDLSDSSEIYEVPIFLMDYPWIVPQATFEENWSKFEDQMILLKKTGGLANLLWHPNNIAENTYRDYWDKMISWIGQGDLYLDSLENILQWWKSRSAVELTHLSVDKAQFNFELNSDARIENLTLEILSPKALNLVQRDGRLAKLENNTYHFRIPVLEPGRTKFEFSYTA